MVTPLPGPLTFTSKGRDLGSPKGARGNIGRHEQPWQFLDPATHRSTESRTTSSDADRDGHA